MPSPTSRKPSSREVNATTPTFPKEEGSSTSTSDKVGSASTVLKKEVDQSDKPKLKKRVWKWIKNKYCVIKNQILKIFKSLRGKKKDEDEVNERSKSEIIIVNPVARELSKDNSQSKKSVSSSDSSSDTASSSSAESNIFNKVGDTVNKAMRDYANDLLMSKKEPDPNNSSGSSDKSEQIVVYPQDNNTSNCQPSLPPPSLLPIQEETLAPSEEDLRVINPLLLLSDDEIFSIIIEDQITKEKNKIDFEKVDQHRRKFPEKFNVEAEDKAFLASLLEDTVMSRRIIERLKANPLHIDHYRRGLSNTRELPYDALVRDDLFKDREALVERLSQQSPETKAQWIQAYKDQWIQSDKK